jgi:hypothetical protein
MAMRFLRITTPTELDLREIITLGLTTKANTDKIGHKGSGLNFTSERCLRFNSLPMNMYRQNKQAWSTCDPACNDPKNRPNQFGCYAVVRRSAEASVITGYPVITP